MFHKVEERWYMPDGVGGYLHKRKIYETEAKFRRYGLHYPLGRRERRHAWGGYAIRRAWKHVDGEWQEIFNV